MIRSASEFSSTSTYIYLQNSTCNYLRCRHCNFRERLTFNSIDTNFHASTTALENIVEKEEIACNEQFLPIPQCFLLNQIIVSPSVHIIYIISSLLLNLKSPKIGISGTCTDPEGGGPEHPPPPGNLEKMWLSDS